MFALRSRGLSDLLSGVGCRFVHRRSSPATPTGGASKRQLVVDYLVHSLGLSAKEAMPVATKVRRFVSAENSDSVVAILKRYGVAEIQIRSMLSSAPYLLLYRAETLERKIRAIQNVGLLGSDFVTLISKIPQILRGGVGTSVIPVVSFLREVLASDERVVKVMIKFGWIVSALRFRRIRANVEFLRSCGLSDEMVRRLVIYNLRTLTVKTKIMEDAVRVVEGRFGIPSSSPMFIFGILAHASMSKSSIENKIQVFRSFGWSDSDVYVLARRQPLCLGLSEGKIHTKLNFFMKELGYSPDYLAARGCILQLSLERRVKPRIEVMKGLKEHSLVKCSLDLYSFVQLSEAIFVRRYVLPYKDAVPHLLENYANSSKR